MSTPPKRISQATFDEAVADNEALTVSSVPFNVILLADETPVDLQPPVLGTLSFDCVEEY
jgi:hypothetical protein